MYLNTLRKKMLKVITLTLKPAPCSIVMDKKKQRNAIKCYQKHIYQFQYERNVLAVTESRLQNAGLQKKTHFKYEWSRPSDRSRQIYTAIPFMNNV